MIRGQTELVHDALVAQILVCPRDHADLEAGEKSLTCPAGHRYPIVDGIPLMLLDDVVQTHYAADDSLTQARESSTPEYGAAPDGGIDLYVQAAIQAAAGNLYKPLIGKLSSYPIPALRLPAPRNAGSRLLDIGCNWGRWCVAAARVGYVAVGIDTDLDAIRAAYRVAHQLGVECHYVVGDARYLPFSASSFSAVFSYSVIQHFSKMNAMLTLAEVGRVLECGGVALIQMANAFGVRNLYQQARRNFREPIRFGQVRYWRPAALRAAVASPVGPASLSIDGFFSLNPQPTDLAMLPARYRLVVHASEFLRRAGSVITPLLYVADSIYVTAHKPG